jgi:hypothetical protein
VATEDATAAVNVCNNRGSVRVTGACGINGHFFGHDFVAVAVAVTVAVVAVAAVVVVLLVVKVFMVAAKR